MKFDDIYTVQHFPPPLSFEQFLHVQILLLFIF